MKLLHCRLSSVRRHRELTLAFDPGLTLITGANETGKSSLVEALHRTLFLRATATGAPVQRMRSLQHPGHPQVDLQFQARGREWALQKRFSGQSGTTSLKGTGEAPRLGSEAEEHLATLLGVEEIVGSRQAGRVLPSRWAHLWVMQGEAGKDLLQLGGEYYDLHGLIEQLEQRADAALQSPLDQQLHRQLEQLVSSSLTSRGTRHQSRLWQCEQAVEERRLQLDAATANLERYEQASAELDAIEDKHRQLEQVQRPRLEAERQRLVALQQQQDKALAERKGVEQQLIPMQQQQSQLAMQQRNLRQTKESLQRQQTQLKQVDVELNRLCETINKAEETVNTARRNRDQSEAERSALEQQGQRLRRLEEHNQLQERLRHLIQQRQQQQAWQQELVDITKALAGLTAPTQEELNTLKDQHRQLEAVKVRLEAMASVVTLERSDQEVRLDDESLATGESQRRSSTFALSIGKNVRVRISPGGGAGLGELCQDRKALQDAIETSLKTWQATSLEELDGRCQKRMQLLTRESLLKQQRSSAGTEEGLEKDEQTLRQRLRDLDEELTDEELTTVDPSLPEPSTSRNGDTLQQQLAHCRSRYRQVKDEGQKAQQGLQELEQRFATVRNAHQALQLKREGLLAETRSLHQQEQTMIRDHGDGTVLTETLRQLTDQIEQLRSKLSAFADTAGSDDDQPPNAASQLATLRQEEQAMQTQLQNLSAERGGLLERCRSLGKGDPYAVTEESRTLLHQAEQDHQDEAMQVRAHQHLLELFDTARSDLSSRYTAPISDGITSYLTPLLRNPDDACALNYAAKDGLKDLSLQRDGLTLPFTALSGGMKEQLNAALRLAIADALRSGHDNCLPILFDDAFTNTDPERLQTVLAMLRKAVDRGLQVIVLSCDGSPYCEIADAVVTLG